MYWSAEKKMKWHRTSHCWDTAVSTVTRLWAGWSKVLIPVGVGDLSLTKKSKSSLGATKVTTGSPPEQSSQGMTLTTYFYLVPRKRIRGAIPPLYMPLLCVYVQLLRSLLWGNISDTRSSHLFDIYFWCRSNTLNRIPSFTQPSSKYATCPNHGDKIRDNINSSYTVSANITK